MSKDDVKPYRSGYVHAGSEEEAARKVTEAMGDDPRADAFKVTSTTVPSIPHR